MPLQACFAVSSRPAVLSGPFAFSFRAGSFVIPHWEELAELSRDWPTALHRLAGTSRRSGSHSEMLGDLGDASNEAMQCNGTVVSLPLDRADHLSSPLTMARLKHEVQSEVLLFLRQVSAERPFGLAALATRHTLVRVGLGLGLALVRVVCAANRALTPPSPLPEQISELQIHDVVEGQATLMRISSLEEECATWLPGRRQGSSIFCVEHSCHLTSSNYSNGFRDVNSASEAPAPGREGTLADATCESKQHYVPCAPGLKPETTGHLSPLARLCPYVLNTLSPRPSLALFAVS